MKKLLLVTLLALGAGQALAANMPLVPSLNKRQPGFSCAKGFRLVLPAQIPGRQQEPYCELI